MARKRQFLDSQVKAFKPYHDRDRWENDGNGLYIRIRPTGTKSFVLRRKIKGETKRATLGQYGNGPHQLTLRKARLEAGRVRLEDQEKKRDTVNFLDTTDIRTFGDLLDQFYNVQIERDHKNPRPVRLYIDNRIPDSVKQLDITGLSDFQALRFRSGIQNWLVGYAKSSGPVGANRLLSILKQATKYGVAAGKILADPLAPLTKKEVGGSEKSRTRTLTDSEIRKLWNSDSEHTPLLKFLMLTGARISEAQRAFRTDISNKRWHIPAENSKNGRAHWVPVVGEIRKIINNLPEDRDQLFATRSTTGTQAWLRRWCNREKIMPRFTPHDLRRTMVTRLNELGAAPYVVEKLVNHTMSGVMATYNRAEYADERTAAAQLWSDHVLEIVKSTSL